MGVRVSKTERNKNRRSSDPSTRFAIGAASIGAVCAAMAPFRAVPWIGAQVATRMIRSKVWWYGSYEALKAATNSQATIEIPHPGVLEEREQRRVVSAGDAMRRARGGTRDGDAAEAVARDSEDQARRVEAAGRLCSPRRRPRSRLCALIFFNESRKRRLPMYG